MTKERRIETLWAVLAAIPLVNMAIVPSWTTIATIPLLLFFFYLVLVEKKKLVFSTLSIAMMGFFMVYVIWAFVSNEQGLAVKEVEHRLMFLLAPLFFAPKQRGDLRVFFAVLTIGVLVGLALSIHKALLCMDTIGTHHCWYSSYFSFIMHPTYQMVYAFVAAMGCVWLALRASKKAITLIWLSLLLPIFWFIHHLDADAVVLCVLALGSFVFFLPYSRFSKKKLWIGGLLLASVMVIGGIAFVNSSAAQSRNLDLFKTYLSNPEAYTDSIKDSNEGNKLRLMVWYTAAEKIGEHPMGAGTDMAKSELLSGYEDHGFVHALDHELNAHNQYMQTWLSVGPFGLAVLLSIFIIALWQGVKLRRWMLAFFSVLFLLNCLVENMLEVQAGIVYFCIGLMVFEKWGPVGMEDSRPWWKKAS